MIVVDSSALIAILTDEPDASFFIDVLADETNVFLSSISYLEASIVLRGKAPHKDLWPRLDTLIVDANITLISFTPEQATLAREAFDKFGKGRHKAKLNFGDCATYALSKYYDAPLLFKGKDFIHTDLKLLLNH